MVTIASVPVRRAVGGAASEHIKINVGVSITGTFVMHSQVVRQPSFPVSRRVELLGALLPVSRDKLRQVLRQRPLLLTKSLKVGRGPARARNGPAHQERSSHSTVTCHLLLAGAAPDTSRRAQAVPQSRAKTGRTVCTVGVHRRMSCARWLTISCRNSEPGMHTSLMCPTVVLFFRNFPPPAEPGSVHDDGKHGAGDAAVRRGGHDRGWVVGMEAACVS